MKRRGAGAAGLPSSAVTGRWRVTRLFEGEACTPANQFESDGPFPCGLDADGTGGGTATEIWSIIFEGGQIKLFSPHGSCYGEVGNGGAVFNWQGENSRASSDAIRSVLYTTIEFHLTSADEMCGTATNQLHVPNGRGELIRIPAMIWSLRAVRDDTSGEQGPA